MLPVAAAALLVLFHRSSLANDMPGLLRTSDSEGSARVRILAPEEGSRLPEGQPIELVYEAEPGFKGRYVQLQLDDQEPIVLESFAGRHTFRDVRPGRHEIRVKVLNPAHAELSAEDSVVVIVGPAKDQGSE